MPWSGITSVVTYSAANAIAIPHPALEPIKVTTAHPGTGGGGIVTFYGSDGKSVATANVSASDPVQTIEFSTASQTLNYSTSAAFASPGLSIVVNASQIPAPLSYDPATRTTAFDGPVVAESFQATDGAQDFFPAYASGVPAVSSLQILGNQSQRVALPTGTAYRLTFRGYGPFAYRLGSDSVEALATDAPGLIDPTIVVPAVPGATHIAVYGVNGGVGSLVVEGGSSLPKTGFVPVYDAGVPAVAILTCPAGIASRVALPEGCTAFRLTFRDYGPFAYRQGGSSVDAVATDAPGDVLSPIVVPLVPGATHLSVYGLGAGSVVVEGGVKA